MPLTNGDYVVRLHFAEIVWGAPGNGLNGGAGSRVMNVSIENQLKLINFDVAKEVGAATALVKNIPVTVTDGKLNIDFSANVNRPMVNAVEVYSFRTTQVTSNFLNLSSFEADSTDNLYMNSSVLAVSETSPLISSSVKVLSTISMISEKETYGSKNNFEKAKVYPNPLHKKFTIDFPTTYKGNYTIQIVDQLGKVNRIGQTNLKAGGTSMEVDISNLSLKAGIYFLRIISNSKKSEIIKLIII